MITLENGNPQSLAGLIVPNGSISFQLNVDATVIASPYGVVLADVPVTFQFNAQGKIQPNAPATAAQIYSNAELNPQNSVGLGTYYLVTFYDQNGARLNQAPMWWQFTQSANSTVDIGEIIPFATVGGNVIFYPTSFTLQPPTLSSLGGVYANVATANEFVTAINTNGSVSLAQPSFANISGTLSASQLPSPLTLPATAFSALLTAQAGIAVGVAGTTSGQIFLEGSTSGSCTITAPAIAGTSTNPILFSNSINIPSGTVFSLNNDTGISRASAGTIDVGNGTAGNASGYVNAAGYQVSGSQIAAANLANGTTGSGSIVLAASPTLTGTLAASAITASGLITAQANIQLGVAGTTSGVVTMEGSTSGSCTITAPAVAGTITNPILHSNSIEIPSGTVYQISTDTGLSRQSAGVVAVGNGSAGNTSGTIQANAVQLGAIGTGPTVTFGAGAPSGSAVNGSLYVNTSGAHSSTTLLYIYNSATTSWVAIA